MSVLSLIVCVLLLSAAYLVARVRALTTVQAHMVQLEAEQRDLRVKHDAVMTEIGIRIDRIDQYLFGEVQSKIDKPKQTTVVVEPPWQRNRDRELRDTLIAIQKRLMRIENLLKDEVP